MLSRRSLIKGIAAGVATAAALVTYPFYEVMARPVVTRYALTPLKWSAGLKLRLVVLADFHACEPWMSAARIRSICQDANGLKADIVLLLGDYVAGTNFVTEHVTAKDWAEELGQLRAPLGVHAVLGNHDYWEDRRFQRNPDAENIADAALRSVGINTYINDAVRIVKNGRAFWLAGLGDQMAFRPGRMRSRAGIDDLPKTLSIVDDDAPILLMAHEPDIFGRLDNRVSLTISGHTHGGQINIMGWRPAAASQGSRKYPAGHFREDDKDLIVSRGLGCSVLPIRIGSRPEIVLIDLG